jgi:hypothetical protein
VQVCTGVCRNVASIVLRQAGQAVAAGDQDVLHSAVGQLGADSGPELRAFAGLYPDGEHVLDAVGVDAGGQVRGLVSDPMPVADLTTSASK